VRIGIAGSSSAGHVGEEYSIQALPRTVARDVAERVQTDRDGASYSRTEDLYTAPLQVQHALNPSVESSKMSTHLLAVHELPP
jgi:hypothetical protein